MDILFWLFVWSIAGTIAFHLILGAIVLFVSYPFQCSIAIVVALAAYWLWIKDYSKRHPR